MNSKSINLNARIKVKLTEYGLSVYTEYVNQIGVRVIDNNPEREFQLHEFMYISGSHLYAGNANVIEPINIELVSDLPVVEVDDDMVSIKKRTFTYLIEKANDLRRSITGENNYMIGSATGILYQEMINAFAPLIHTESKKKSDASNN